MVGVCRIQEIETLPGAAVQIRYERMGSLIEQEAVQGGFASDIESGFTDNTGRIKGHQQSGSLRA